MVTYWTSMNAERIETSLQRCVAGGERLAVKFRSNLSVFTLHLYKADSISNHVIAKAFGQLVRLGFDVTVFTPASYQRHRL